MANHGEGFSLDRDAARRLEETTLWKERQPQARTGTEIPQPKPTTAPAPSRFRLYTPLECNKPAIGVRLKWDEEDKIWYDDDREEIIIMGHGQEQIVPAGAEVMCIYIPGASHYVTTSPSGQWGWNNYEDQNLSFYINGVDPYNKLVPYGCYCLDVREHTNKDQFQTYALNRADLRFNWNNFSSRVGGYGTKLHGFLKNIPEGTQTKQNGKKGRIGEFYERPNDPGRQYRRLYEIVQPPCWVAYELLHTNPPNFGRESKTGDPQVGELFSTPIIDRNGFVGGPRFDRNEVAITLFWWRWVPDELAPSTTSPGSTVDPTGVPTPGETTTTGTPPEPPQPIWYFAPNQWWRSGEFLSAFGNGVAQDDLDGYYGKAGFIPLGGYSPGQVIEYFGNIVGQTFNPQSFRYDTARAAGFDFQRSRLFAGAAGDLWDGGFSWGQVDGKNGYGTGPNNRVDDFDFSRPDTFFTDIVMAVRDNIGDTTGRVYNWKGHIERLAVMGYIVWNRGYKVQHVDVPNQRIFISGIHGHYATFEPANFDPALLLAGVPQGGGESNTSTPPVTTPTPTPTPTGTPTSTPSETTSPSSTPTP